MSVLPEWLQVIFECLRIVAPIGSLILVIIGWHFVRADNNKREDRRELRSLLDSIIEDIEKLQAKGFEYYLSGPEDANAVMLQIQLKTGLELLQGRISTIRRLHSKYFIHPEDFVALNRNLTGGDFESSQRVKRPPTDSKFLEIALSSKQLTLYLESEYSKCVQEHFNKK